MATLFSDELELQRDEDPMTADLPLADPCALAPDLGDTPPAGAEHALADVVDTRLGVDAADVFAVEELGSRPLGLNARDRIRARDLAVEAAALAARKHALITYTMGSRRWDPIARNRKAWRGEVGRFEDCSSFATWCLWHGFDHFGLPDEVNGERFQGGFTGTLVEHGVRVARAEILRGDLTFYANEAGAINHTAIYVGGGMVISHGSQGGPVKVDMDYRRIVQIRRYIRP